MENQVAMIFGASRGVGRAIALAFAREGARIACAGRHLEILARTEQEVLAHEASCATFACDVAHEEQVAAATAGAVEKFGRLDVVVNSAVWMDPFAPVVETRLEDWRTSIDVDLTGAFLVSKHALREMAKHGKGRLIHISSALAGSGCSHRAAYSAAKAGLNDLVKTLAMEMAHTHVKVNAISPRGIAGEHNKEMRARLAKLFGEEVESDEAYGSVAQTMMQAEEVAALAVFLAGPTGARINGQSIVIGEPSSSGW